MTNRFVGVGRLTRDPDYRVSQSNIAIANFNLAINRPFTGKDGEKQADFINVVVFRRQAENVNMYLSKGDLCSVDGRLQTRSYENKDGQRIYVTEVVADNITFLETKGNSGKTQRSGQNNNRNDQNPYANADGPMDISDDDLPF